jgi:hypothetical protein
MPELSDTQAVLLSAAAGRDDLSLLPLPDTLRLRGAALERTLRALLNRGLIAEAEQRRGRRSKWAGPQAAADDRRLVVTPAGLAALGVETAQAPASRDAGPAAAATAAAAPERPRPGGKSALLLAAVSRPEGATLAELSAVAGWQPHTTRAALTRLRQQGHDIRLAAMGARRAYHLVPAD